jgi:hypothetical protein
MINVRRWDNVFDYISNGLKEELNKLYMKTFIIALLFMTATFLPILFIPLLGLTIVVIALVAPYVTTHTKWFESKHDLEHMKH